MKLPHVMVATLLWQSPTLVNLGAPAKPEHLKYERAVRVVSGASGISCAVLDMTVLAHTASASHADLRLFQQLAGEPESETPYTLTESGPEPVADTLATAEHVSVTGNQIRFDLRMPARPYSEVRLRLSFKDVVATATVQGEDQHGARVALGSVAVYDLSDQHLGHWTSLLLGESNWPLLHVVLDVRTPFGMPEKALSPAMVQGAEVPPSRLRQTRYVPTVSTSVIDQHGPLSVAILRVPAHVPVERVVIDVAPEMTANYAREVTVSARADGMPITDTEALDAGPILRVNWPSSDPRLYPISVRENALDATLGATLVRPATVLVSVNNGGRAPLPIHSVSLAMRERKLCFFADREATYTLRYGDEALTAPTYDESALAIPTDVQEAQLGPEEFNPNFQTRHETRSLLKRHPEIFWLAVLLCGGMMGGSALHHVQHRRV